MASLQFTKGPSIPEPYIKTKQLLNHIMDGLAQAHPFSVWAEIPNSATNYGAGFRRVTYRDLSNTINGVAWWLYVALSKGTGFKTLAYIGLWDVRYVILLLGAVKAGYIVSHVIKKPSLPLTSFKPLEFKQQISGHPEIKAALMDGTRRPQAALLIELEDPRGPYEDGHSETMERLWLTIAEANGTCTAQSVTQKSHILFTQAETPLPMAGKETV